MFFEHARGLIEKFGYVGSLFIQMKMESVLGVNWIYYDGRPRPSPGSELDDEVVFELETSTDELLLRRDQFVLDVLKYVFFALNWPDVVNKEENLQRLLADGNDYNLA